MMARERVDHAKRVESVVTDKRSRFVEKVPERRIHTSWERCLSKYNIDPSTTTKPRILSSRELRNYIEPLEEFLFIARSGIKRLYEKVVPAGYVILLGDTNGVTIEFAGDPKDESDNRNAGLYLGSVWSESVEGTCGVGTCIEEKRAMTIHRDEHFRARHIGLSCSTTPLLFPDGSLLGTLDISLVRPPESRDSQILALQMVDYFARLIENAHFLRLYQDSWIIRFNSMQAFVEVAAENLVAVSSDGSLVAANLSAQKNLAPLQDGMCLKGRHVTELFDITIDDLMNHALHKTTTILPVRSTQNGRQYFATFRAPESSIIRIREKKEITNTALVGSQRPSSCMTLEYLSGADPQMLSSANCARRVMNKDISILLIGETGTGKEVFAHAIHHASARALKPFVALNCASIPESLIESELFGYKQGAFTGARSKGMRGKILQADGGTLFLDEIGDMPLNLQTRLLRVLAESEILPLGSETPVRVDLHVICATLRNLEELVRKGEFREDLYYRLNGVTITLPPLRERKDKALLIENILVAEKSGQAITFEPDAFEILMSVPWPGNVRQLRNVIRYSIAVSDGETIQLSDLPPEILQVSSLPLETIMRSTASSSEQIPPDSMQYAERSAILNVLKKNKWNITDASTNLRISRATLYRKMKKFEIIPPNEL
jgi:transcriptional regulator of acetoin/glycerol metabolism